MSGRGAFGVWKRFQRRSESLARALDLETLYYHWPWEERGRLLKALSYVPKFLGTLFDLWRRRPSVVFLQLAPTPVLYAGALYAASTGARYVADCHNTMLYDSTWLRWPLAAWLLRRADLVLVHNEDVLAHARANDIDALVLRDPLPEMTGDDSTPPTVHGEPARAPYVIVPWGMASDEPFGELFEAAAALPEVPFYVTWFASRLPAPVRDAAPGNVVFTDYLPEDAFNRLFRHAALALVLTTREGTQPSGASEAIASGVPLVVSDLATTRRLYRDGARFVENRGASIEAGVRATLADGPAARAGVAALRLRIDDAVATELRSACDALELPSPRAAAPRP